MRILLAAKHAPHGKRPIGGVQTWCRTVAHELQRRGHEAVTWGPEQPPPLGGFDFGIINNVGDTNRAFAWCKKTLVVSHGIIPAERPPDAGNVAFTSEEIRSHWNGDGPIIRQPIDLRFWTPKTTIPLYGTRFSYRGGLRFVPTLAKRVGMRYYHLRSQGEESVRNVLQKSAFVLATGRAALEAMACDVPVVLCDHRSAYQGPLMDLDIEHAMTRNYSGRGGIVPTPENTLDAIAASMTARGMRNHVEQHHDVREIVDQLVEFA